MFDQLMRAIPTDQLARQLGEDPATTRAAVQAALPALLGGLTANAQDRGGAESLLGALGRHDDGLSDDMALDRVDTQDGEKILGHVFGANTDTVVNQLGGLGGGQSSALVRRLLPILAPIVLSWLAKQVTGAGRARTGGDQLPGGGRPGGLPGGQVVQPDGPLGQGRPQSDARPTGQDSSRDGHGGQGGLDMTSVLQDVLGGALGGATGQTGRGGGSVLSDVLGGLLGGRR